MESDEKPSAFLRESEPYFWVDTEIGPTSELERSFIPSADLRWTNSWTQNMNKSRLEFEILTRLENSGIFWRGGILYYWGYEDVYIHQNLEAVFFMSTILAYFTYLSLTNM